MKRLSFGSEKIPYKGIAFYLRRTGGQRHGHYLENWLYVNPAPKFFIGHAESGNFSRGSFLVLSSKHKLGDLLLATEDPGIQDLARQNEEALNKIGKILFYKNFCHITVNREIHIGWPKIFNRKFVLRNIVAPSEGTEHLDAVINLMSCFSLTPAQEL